MCLAHQPIREIVAALPTSLAVFERFDIDLCAMGDHTLADACAALSLSLDQLEEKLAAHLPAESAADPATLTPMQLIQRIVRVHHRRIRQDLPALCRMAERLEAKHTGTFFKSAALAGMLRDLHTGLLAHIDAEEQILFPLIAQHAEDTPQFTTLGPARSISHNLRRIHQDHEAATQTMDGLRERTNGFTPPHSACATHRALFSGLASFEQDLRSHLHLEDDILFPRALHLNAAGGAA